MNYLYFSLLFSFLTIKIHNCFLFICCLLGFDIDSRSKIIGSSMVVMRVGMTIKSKVFKTFFCIFIYFFLKKLISKSNHQYTYKV
jgi:hypothetical protein